MLVAVHEVVLVLAVILIVVVVVNLGVDHLVVLGVVQGDLQVLFHLVITLSITEIEVSESSVGARSRDGVRFLSHFLTCWSFFEV